ncbi:TPA: hypothetical protein ACY4RO_001868 [Clostridium perfringens]|uniref:Uncharacterized protein n=1 Tax=Clostridium perfringens TaxID=1502 RepID=A0AAN5NDH7_CLOPF|nr:hypothetical protein [Clostridium perfringens]AQW26540.1 hypothetical protein BXT94_07115 [Clostridium perfringens]EJT6502945.1 hypothetical protein [Clostridium perfringens]HAT4299623.1 hypothetical protein [Clostridium perfringens]
MEKNKRISEAQKRADENWRKNNKEHANYLRARSAARSFIKNKATLEDIKELLELIEIRKNEL